MSETKEITKVNNSNRAEIFSAAYDGSYYTICGCGGDLEEWTKGYTEMLEEHGIGKPERFITFQGKDMNAEYGLTGYNSYQDETHFLMFPLDGLNVGRLAIFKLKAEDRWFDDIVDNNSRRQEAINA